MFFFKKLFGRRPESFKIDLETTEQPRDIFISYSRSDSDQVIQVVGWLCRNGLPRDAVFIDQGGIDGALDFPTVLEKAILNCKILLFFISGNSINSRWVKMEVFLAISRGKSVFPIFLEDVELPIGMNLQLASIQQINLHTGKKEQKYSAILTSLQRLGIGIAKMGYEDVAHQSQRPVVSQQFVIRVDGSEGPKESYAHDSHSRPLIDGEREKQENRTLPDPDKLISEINYETVRELAITKNLLQRDMGWKKIAGKHIQWTAYVHDVDPSGRARVYINKSDALSRSHSLDTATIHLIFSEDRLEQAMTLEQGKQVNFKARLMDLKSYGGGSRYIDLDEVEILDSSIDSDATARRIMDHIKVSPVAGPQKVISYPVANEQPPDRIAESGKKTSSHLPGTTPKIHPDEKLIIFEWVPIPGTGTERKDLKPSSIFGEIGFRIMDECADNLKINPDAYELFSFRYMSSFSLNDAEKKYPIQIIENGVTFTIAPQEPHPEILFKTFDHTEGIRKELSLTRGHVQERWKRGGDQFNQRNHQGWWRRKLE